MMIPKSFVVRAYGLLVSSLLAGLVFSANAQPYPTASIDDELQLAVESVVRGFKGEIGVYVQHLTTGRSAEIRADVVFPSASLIKVPILVNTVDRIEHGLLDIDAKYPFRDTLRTVGAGFLSGFRDGEMVSVREMMQLMSAASDNTAALWLQQLGGSGTEVNDWLESNDFLVTKVNAGTPGRRRQWKQYNWGQTSPREIAKLFVAISTGSVVSPTGSDLIHRMLSRSFVDSEGLSMVPLGIQAISKQGSVERSRSEVILVYAPSGPYVFAVLTKNIRDISWDADNEAFRMQRSISSKLWQYFEQSDR